MFQMTLNRQNLDLAHNKSLSIFQVDLRYQGSVALQSNTCSYVSLGKTSMFLLMYTLKYHKEICLNHSKQGTRRNVFLKVFCAYKIVVLIIYVTALSDFLWLCTAYKTVSLEKLDIS